MKKDILPNYGFVNPPIYRGSTVIVESTQKFEEIEKDPLKQKDYVYGRLATPTSRAFESALTELEGGYATVTTSSGLSAITTAISALVKSGDHILVSDSVYVPTRVFCNDLKRFGVETEYFDPTIGSAIESKFRNNTKLVYLESPGSISFEILDTPAITEVCRKRQIITLTDNTWATPIFCKPLNLGVDVVIHSATKYIGGHSDSFLGAIVCNEKTYSAIRTQALQLGQCAGPEDLYLGLRGLRTLEMRLKAHEQQGLNIAQWLENRDEVAKVFHPALPSHEGHSLWKRDFSGASGVFSFALKQGHDKAKVHKVVDSLNVFRLGGSWGGFESLVMPSDPKNYRTVGWTDHGTLIRLHVGFEKLEDLKTDLDQALSRLSLSPLN